MIAIFPWRTGTMIVVHVNAGTRMDRRKSWLVKQGSGGTNIGADANALELLTIAH